MRTRPSRRANPSTPAWPPVGRLLAVGLAALLSSSAFQFHLGGAPPHRDVGWRLDRIPPVELLLLLPSLPRRLAADVLWVRAIQAYGHHRQTDGNFNRMRDHFDAVTRVDPSLEQAYAFGGLVLAEEGGDPQGGLALLVRGMANLPHSWRLPFEMGFVYYVDLGDAARAARYFDLAASFPEAPDYAKHFAAFAYLRAGQRDMARCFWAAIYEEAPTEAIRQLAADALRRLEEEEERESERRTISRLSPGAHGRGGTAGGA